MTANDLEKVREQELDGFLTDNGRANAIHGFRAGFTSGVAAVVEQLKNDLRNARNTEAIARQQATACGYPADAMRYMRGACEARFKVEYLQNLIYCLTGEEY